MSFFKNEKNGYIESICETGYEKDGNLTESEYYEILNAIQNKPVIKNGFDYRLKTDLTWEEYELPPEEPSEATEQDFLAALEEVGVIESE